MATAASPVLVVLGWYFVDARNNARETRKEVRQLLDRALENVEACVQAGVEFHGHKAVNPKDQSDRPNTETWKLVILSNSLSAQIRLLGEHGLNMHSCGAPYINLKKILTGGDFMTASWKPWGVNDTRWTELLFAQRDLTVSLEKAFFSKFNSTKDA